MCSHITSMQMDSFTQMSELMNLSYSQTSYVSKLIRHMSCPLSCTRKCHTVMRMHKCFTLCGFKLIWARRGSSKWEVESTLTQVVLWIWKVEYKCTKLTTVQWSVETVWSCSSSTHQSSSSSMIPSLISLIVSVMKTKLLTNMLDVPWWHTTTTESTQSPTSGLTWALETPFTISTWTERFHTLNTWNKNTMRKSDIQTRH